MTRYQWRMLSAASLMSGGAKMTSGLHRALLRRYPFAVFFRVRPATEHAVVLDRLSAAR